MGMYRSGSLQTIINHYSVGKKPKLQRRDSVKLRNLGLKDKMKVIINNNNDNEEDDDNNNNNNNNNNTYPHCHSCASGSDPTESPC